MKYIFLILFDVFGLDSFHMEDLVAVDIKHGVGAVLGAVARRIRPPITGDRQLLSCSSCEQLQLMLVPHLFNCRKEKCLLDREEGPVREAGNPHTSQRPQGLLDAAASKQS
uniref:Putative secreted protein n=1 Tax=Ixodes ricinus TaxID=34613 RepID=A0A6B0UJG6_IXORI